MRVWFNGKTTAFQAVVASSILVTRLWSVGQGLRHRLFTAVTRVRISYGLYVKAKTLKLGVHLDTIRKVGVN